MAKRGNKSKKVRAEDLKVQGSVLLWVLERYRVTEHRETLETDEALEKNVVGTPCNPVPQLPVSLTSSFEMLTPPEMGWDILDKESLPRGRQEEQQKAGREEKLLKRKLNRQATESSREGESWRR